MPAAIDATETRVTNLASAEVVLALLPDEHIKLTHWQLWADMHFAHEPWHESLHAAITIAYARMALRNGSLSPHPRPYHNESHINDLLLRIIYCAQQSPKPIPKPGLAVLGYFAVCHDLRQAEPPKPPDDDSLVGANESASFEEAIRIIDQVNDCLLWTEHNRLLLKTMIEGSTFGSGGKRSKNFFQGNLALHLLDKLNLSNNEDEELVLLACDLDTANVSLPLHHFAQSAIAVYDELISHQQVPITAQHFFSEQQKIYFFDQQAFHAQLTRALFEPHKQKNGKKLLELSAHIAAMDSHASDEDIKAEFLHLATYLAHQ